jgi:hypothetical protein
MEIFILNNFQVLQPGYFKYAVIKRSLIIQYMKKFCSSFFITAIMFSSLLNGQINSRQAGIRLGYRGGIFYQLSHEAGNAEIAYNGMIGFSDCGIQITGLKIIYETSLSSISPDLFFAWGYGGHAGFIYTDQPRYFTDTNNYRRRLFCPVAGIDGWLAAEYRVREIPLTVSLNLKPFIETAIPVSVRAMPLDLALSVSYIF